MKFSSFRTICLGSAPALLLAASLVPAQTRAPGPAQAPNPTQTQAPEQTQTQSSDPAQTPNPRGTVLFERRLPDPAQTPASEDPEAPGGTALPGDPTTRKDPHVLHRHDGDTRGEPEVPVEGQTGVSSSSSASAATPANDGIPPISDADRNAATITATDLDLHLNAHTGEAVARAQLTVANSGSAPVGVLTLRISGALRWESVRMAAAGNVPLPVLQHPLSDDLDHTGSATELVVPMPQPLQPGATVRLDTYFAGTLTASQERLIALGAPVGRATLTDWDTVTDTFTGLRGLGNVLWYPVTGAPASLANGDAVTAAVEGARTRDAASAFHLRLVLEYDGARPDAAWFCGDRQLLEPLTPGGKAGDEGGVVTAAWTRTALGPHTPSLFIAPAAPHTAADGLLRVVTNHTAAVTALREATGKVRPMLAEWLGARNLRPLDVLDLPIPSAAPFADGSLLVVPLENDATASLAPALVGPLTSVWLPDNLQAAWLRDGIPAFLQVVWAERTRGRAAALQALAASAATLRVTSPVPKKTDDGISSSLRAPDEPTGPPLATCLVPACTRGKTAYVLEMLRGMMGDGPLAQAISGWREHAIGTTGSTGAEETASMERLLQQVARPRDLQWFFGSWIDANQGLPELTIVTVAPRKVERDAPVNYLPPKKQMYSGPIGAEPVPQPGDPDDVARRRPVTPGDRVAPAPGSWMVAVEVQNNGSADAEVPVTVLAGGLTNTLPLRVAAHSRATVRIPFEADPQEVQVNDGSVPEQRTTVHRRTITNLSNQ